VSLMASMRDRMDKLEPRERRLLGLLGVIFGVMALLGAPMLLNTTLDEKRDENAALRDAIFAVKEGRATVRERTARREAIVARYANKAPALAGLLEKAAREQQLEIPESQDRPEIPHGKNYVERSTVIRLRKTTMLQLAKMLETIEQQKMPLSIGRLNIRKRGGEHDSYDVEIGLSAFDRIAQTPKAVPAGQGGE